MVYLSIVARVIRHAIGGSAREKAPGNFGTQKWKWNSDGVRVGSFLTMNTNVREVNRGRAPKTRKSDPTLQLFVRARRFTSSFANSTLSHFRPANQNRKKGPGGVRTYDIDLI